ncbi:efflux RND transporter periplasmic adaptor subunit [Prevotella sp. AGR2160]|uniref:efflux RND transporter periplasmic adaptor subunit n=1 Tax=Prevotella sp. AGR2160 TaxID=1280674 RepID=UPI0018CB94EF|nr:HlyD family efflux transporter periplasmic adaptor subunit [Prevotella sp. AGR2160]
MNKYLFALILPLLAGCGSSQQPQPEPTPSTAVTTTTIHQGAISQQITLQAQTDYLHQITLTAPVTGYIRALPVRPDDMVRRGSLLFTMVSAEQQALGVATTPLSVHASCQGLVSSVLPQVGSFVTEGSPVCIITDLNSLVFKVKVPSDYSRQIHTGSHGLLILPDGRRSSIVLSRPLMEMNTDDQTVAYVARASVGFLPAGLTAQVIFTIGSTSGQHQVLPKEAVQSDANLSSFWVMVAANDTTATRVPVTIGNQNRDEVEILSPHFSPSTRIIVQGAYGLDDQARIRLSEGR